MRRRPWGARAFVLMTAGLVAAGCGQAGLEPRTIVGSAPYVEGSGVRVTETRPLPLLHAVEASSAVRVSVGPGSTNQAAVTTDDNLLIHVTTEVADGVLRVSIDGNISTHLPPTVVVTVAGPLDGLAADSGSTLQATGLEGEAISIRASHASTLGASGSVGVLVVTAEEGSTADLRGLAADAATVDVARASTAFVRVTGEVSGSCARGSSLHLVGPPAKQSVDADASSTIRVEEG